MYVSQSRKTERKSVRTTLIYTRNKCLSSQFTTKRVDFSEKDLSGRFPYAFYQQVFRNGKDVRKTPEVQEEQYRMKSVCRTIRLFPGERALGCACGLFSRPFFRIWISPSAGEKEKPLESCWFPTVWHGTKMVGVVELESTTSTMSTWRSNQLSYTPSIQIENGIYYTINSRKFKTENQKKRKKHRNQRGKDRKKHFFRPRFFCFSSKKGVFCLHSPGAHAILYLVLSAERWPSGRRRSIGNAV